MKLINNSPNVVTVAHHGFIYHFSYQTLVAISRNGIVLRTDKHYSKTTSRHVNQFVEEWSTFDEDGNQHSYQIGQGQLARFNDVSSDEKLNVWSLLVEAYSY